MDQRERIADPIEGLRSLLEDFAVHLWTAIPGIVQSFNATQNTVVVQPAVKSRTRDQFGNITWQNLPQINDVPVVFPAGGNYIITYPIQAGDECLLIFSARSIDGWWQQGGVQLQTEMRLQDITDAFAIVGPRSLPKVPTAISTTTVQLRTLDKTCYIELAPGGVVNIVAPGGVNVTGTLGASQEITAKVGAGNHTVSAHIHGGVTTGGGNTGTPTG